MLTTLEQVLATLKLVHVQGQFSKDMKFIQTNSINQDITMQKKTHMPKCDFNNVAGMGVLLEET